MQKNEDRKTPIPVGIRKSHSKRLDDLEEVTKELTEGQGKLAGDIGNLRKQIEGTGDSDRPSAQFSMSPTGVRAKFFHIKGMGAWVIVSIVVIIAIMFIILAVVVGSKP